MNNDTVKKIIIKINNCNDNNSSDIYNEIMNLINLTNYDFHEQKIKSDTLGFHTFLISHIEKHHEEKDFDFTITKNFAKFLVYGSSQIFIDDGESITNNYLILYKKMKKKLTLDVVKTLRNFFAYENKKINKQNLFCVLDINNELLNYLIYSSESTYYFGKLQHCFKYNAFFFDLIEHSHKNGIILSPSDVIKIIYTTQYEKNYKTQSETIQFFIDIGYKFTDDIHNAIFTSRNVDTIITLLNTKIKISPCMFSNLFSSFYNSRIQECINVCINYGYDVTKDDLILMLNKRVNIENKLIKKEYLDDKIFVENITKIINEKNLFPNAFEIKPNIETLLTMIRNFGKIDDIKKLIKENKLKPTIECLREACKNKSYTTVIKYLNKEHKLKIDEECLKNAIASNGNSCLNYVSDSYFK